MPRAAAEVPSGEQRKFLETECPDDRSLVPEVMALLEEDARDNSLLDGSVGQIAQQILEGSTAAAPFKEFGPYKILRILGEGGMGTVYLVAREDLGSLGAMKILRDAWLSPARRERFAIEQRTLASLTHPLIARLYDADTSADGTPFFVMEFVDGVPLTDYCDEHDCTLERRLKLFRSVCEAVQFAHRHTVIHRDLKPSNIFVKGDGTVRLLDFGIAKQLENLGDTANQTMTGLRLMTPAYASPEQIRGEQVGVQTDGWHGRYSGCRLNCENVPILPAVIVRRVWDPRDIPYSLSWSGRQDGLTKDRVRIYRNPPGSDPSGRDSVEVITRHGDFLDIFIEWRHQPNGGRCLLLACLRCQEPRRALYGSKVGDNGRSHVVCQVNWECRRCAGLRYSSEGGALIWRASVLTKALMRPCEDVRLPRPPIWCPELLASGRKLGGTETIKR